MWYLVEFALSVCARYHGSTPGKGMIVTLNKFQTGHDEWVELQLHSLYALIASKWIHYYPPLHYSPPQKSMIISTKRLRGLISLLLHKVSWMHPATLQGTQSAVSSVEHALLPITINVIWDMTPCGLVEIGILQLHRSMRATWDRQSLPHCDWPVLASGLIWLPTVLWLPAVTLSACCPSKLRLSSIIFKDSVRTAQ